jgi:hypothetical protein
MRFPRRLSSSASRALLSLLALTLSVGVVFRWWIVEHATKREPAIMMDTLHYFFPMLEAGFRSLRSGELFLWNPYQMNGMPGLATLQAGYLYPAHLVYLILPTATGMGVMAFAHTLLAGCGMLMLSRALGFGWLAGIAAGLFFGVVTVLPLFIYPATLESAAWLPFGILAIERLRSQPAPRWLLLLGMAVGMPVLAGSAQAAAALFYCYALWMLAGLVRILIGAQPSAKPAARYFFQCATGVVGGILVAAPQLLPTAELSGFTERTASMLSYAEIIPHGRPYADTEALRSLLFTAPGEFFEIRHYVGVVALIISMLGLIRLRWQALPLLVLIVFGLISLSAPLWFLDVRSMLPALGWFRFPEREFLVAKFAVALLIAGGISELSRPSVRGRAAALAAIVTLPAAAWLCVGARALEPSVARLLLPALLACGLLLKVRGNARRAVLLSSVLLLLAYDCLGRSHNSYAVPYAHDQWRALYENQELHRLISAYDQYDRALVLDAPVKEAMLFGTFSPGDYDPLVISWFHDCLRLASGEELRGRKPDEMPFYGMPVFPVALLAPPHLRCLELSAVSLAVIPPVLMRSREAGNPWQAIPEQVAARSDRKPQPILARNNSAVRRAYGVYDVECRPSREEEISRALESSFDPRTAVVLAEGPHCTGPAARPDAPLPFVSIVRHETTEIEIRAILGAPGFVVLADNFYPGWHARVDGRDTEIQRANGMFRAVRAPAGESRIVFRYRPTSFYRGLWLFGAGLLLIAGVAARMRRTSVNGRDSPGR